MLNIGRGSQRAEQNLDTRHQAVIFLLWYQYQAHSMEKVVLQLSSKHHYSYRNSFEM